MKRAILGLGLTLAFVVLLGCGSTEYIISTTDGDLITTNNKPKLDAETGMYAYKDSEGRSMTIRQDEVKQIMER